MNYQVDDGFVIYVNGQEAGRYNMPDGTITSSSFSTSYAGDTPLTGTIELPSSLFKSGNNTIAVEIHNNSYTSSDQYWAAELLTSVESSSSEIVSTDPVMNLTANNSKQTLVACFTPLSSEEQVANGVTPVRINEVSAANDIYVNEYFKRNDWVELYNTTDQPIDVEGMYLSDNAKKPQKYQIGKGESVASTIIPAHGYLVVWCDKLEPQSQLHASFKLDADGGDVLLTAADESWTDVLTYTVHNEDQTVGRYPDGSNQVFVMNVPTIAKTNITSSYALNISDGPSTGISEHMMTPRQDNQQIYNLNGQVVNGALAPGIYIKNGRKFVVTRK